MEHLEEAIRVCLANQDTNPWAVPAVGPTAVETSTLTQIGWYHPADCPPGDFARFMPYGISPCDDCIPAYVRL